MSLYTEIRHPRAHAGRGHDPARRQFDGAGRLQRAAGRLDHRPDRVDVDGLHLLRGHGDLDDARRHGSVLGFDPYPYPFLLFLGNVVQLLLIFIILLGQQVLGRTADRRSMHTYEDAEAILVDCEQIQNHLIAQDAQLVGARGAAGGGAAGAGWARGSG